MITNILNRLTDWAVVIGDIIAHIPVAFFGMIWGWGIWYIVLLLLVFVGCAKAAPLPIRVYEGKPKYMGETVTYTLTLKPDGTGTYERRGRMAPMKWDWYLLKTLRIIDEAWGGDGHFFFDRDSLRRLR